MNKERYVEYLQSDHFKKLTNDCIEEQNYCMICGSDIIQILLVHHLNYQHLWYETRDDFQILCWRCHPDKKNC
jgi:hypothetical protein